MTAAPFVVLVDVDNTLLDNDRVQDDLKRHLERAFGATSRDRYWAILEALFVELGYRDYLGALQRYRTYEAASIGYPGPVLHGRPVVEPTHLGPGWVGFDYRTALGCPVKVVNDAAMQALGSYEGGKMLFLGLGTGLGTALIVEGIVEPMELGHLPYRDGTFEEYVGLHGLQAHGLTQWRRDVEDVVRRLIAALEPEDVVLGGGNVHQLDTLPPGCRAGDNANAFLGGFRLWKRAPARRHASRAVR